MITTPPGGGCRHLIQARKSDVGKLAERLGDQETRDRVIDDACKVLDAEVADKSGLSGVAIKGAYKMVKGIRPGFVRQVVDHLLDDFIAGIEPVYEEAIEKGADPSSHLVANSGRVADALLAVTDKRAENAKSAMIKKTYSKLRPTAKKHVEAAAPRLGDMLKRHVPAG